MLVGLDGSEFAEAALQPARQLAANLGAQIVLVESVPEFRPRLVDAGVNTFAYVDPETFEGSRSDAETYLLRIQRRLRHDGFETCSELILAPTATRNTPTARVRMHAWWDMVSETIHDS